MDEGEMEKVGERIFNMQRAVLLRQGWDGRQGDRLLDYYYDEPLPGVFFNAGCIAPGKDGEVISWALVQGQGLIHNGVELINEVNIVNRTSS